MCLCENTLVGSEFFQSEVLLVSENRMQKRKMDEAREVIEEEEENGKKIKIEVKESRPF